MKNVILAALSSFMFITGCGSPNSPLNTQLNGESATNSSDYGFGLKNTAYQLNLIGVPKGKSASMTGNIGHRIFLPLFGSTKILLSEGAFQVLDANGTDGSASFQLPSPDPDGDGVTSYSVYARALGKPGGKIRMTTCAKDASTGEEICSLESMVAVRNKGKSSFTNVSRELLSISADIDGDGTIERVPLFDDRLQDYLWSVDNQGLRLLQLRFIGVSTKL